MFLIQVLITHCANCYPTVHIRPWAYNKLIYMPRPSYIMNNVILSWQQCNKRSGMPQCHFFHYTRSITDSLSIQTSFFRKTEQEDDNMKENVLLGKCILKLCQTDALSSSIKAFRHSVLTCKNTHSPSLFRRTNDIRYYRNNYCLVRKAKHGVAQLVRHCATSRKVAVSYPDGV